VHYSYRAFVSAGSSACKQYAAADAPRRFHRHNYHLRADHLRIHDQQQQQPCAVTVCLSVVESLHNDDFVTDRYMVRKKEQKILARCTCWVWFIASTQTSALA